MLLDALQCCPTQWVISFNLAAERSRNHSVSRAKKGCVINKHAHNHAMCRRALPTDES